MTPTAVELLTIMDVLVMLPLETARHSQRSLEGEAHL